MLWNLCALQCGTQYLQKTSPVILIMYNFNCCLYGYKVCKASENLTSPCSQKFLCGIPLPFISHCNIDGNRFNPEEHSTIIWTSHIIRHKRDLEVQFRLNNIINTAQEIYWNDTKRFGAKVLVYHQSDWLCNTHRSMPAHPHKHTHTHLNTHTNIILLSHTYTHSYSCIDTTVVRR